MARFETWLTSDLQKMLQVQPLTGVVFTSDNAGNLIGVQIMDGGEPANVSGGVLGYVIRSDGKTVVVPGSLDGNRASIILPSSVYAVPGAISIVIKLGTTTVGACTAYVYQSSTETIIDPSHVVPDLSELLAHINDAIQAATNANNAATNANAKANAANTAAEAADTAATNANTKANEANTAAAAANAAATKIDGMTVAAAAGTVPTAVISDVDGHKHILIVIPKGDKGDTGDAFHIVKTYSSVAAMNADYSGTDTHVGDYVMVVSGVEDPDNAKVYIKGSQAWGFVVDMSGATGMKGDKGEKGDTGTGITGITYNQDYTITITLGDGTSYTTDVIRGEKGEKGETGNQGPQGLKGDTGTGISSITYNQDYTITIELEDGTTYTTGVVRGEKGETGNQGPQGLKGDTGTGITGITYNQDYTITITLSDGTSYTTGVVRGEKGDKGDPGDPTPFTVVNGKVCITYNKEVEE